MIGVGNIFQTFDFGPSGKKKSNVMDKNEERKKKGSKIGLNNDFKVLFV